MGNDGLTLDDVAQIQADAHKAITRQFRDAAEDSGWKPTEWHPKEELQAFADTQTAPKDKPVFTEDGKPVGDTNSGNTDSTDTTGPAIADLRARAKELNLSAGGSKQDLTTRIAAAEAQDTNSGNTNEGDNQ